MKTLKTLIIIMLAYATGYTQTDVIVESSTPRVIAKMNNAYGGYYFEKSGGIKGGLIYDNNEKVIRLNDTANPQNGHGFSLLTSGTYQGNFAMGMVPGQHYFSIFHNSIKVAGSVNNPNNSAHLALIEDDDDDFARIWFLNSGDNNRWALIGKSNPVDSKIGFAYNGVAKFLVDTIGRANFNNEYMFPNTDGTDGQVLTTNGAGTVSWADGGTGISDIVQDADNDTKITVEETADSDEINIYCEDELMINMKKDSMYIPKGVFSGYGTMDPLDPIHIVAEDDDEFAGFYAEGGTGTKHVHYILDNRTANGKRYSIVSVGDDSGIPNGSFAIRDLDNSTERLVVDPVGNIGIGFNNPARKLHVNGSSTINGALKVNDTLEVGTGIGAKLYIGNDMITDGGANLLRTDASFTPSETATYSLGGFSFKWEDLWMNGNLHIGSGEIYEDGTDKLKTDSHFVPELNNSKNLGESSLRWKDVHLQNRLYIGTQYLTRNSGNNAIQSSTNFTPTSDNSSSLGVGARRWSVVYAANGTINTSDRRAKKDITNLTYGLDDVMKLRPVDFNWKDQINDKKTLGLVAQELLEVIPEVVVESESKDDLLGVKYSDLIPVLISAIQEQQNEIEDLRVKVSTYQNLEEQVTEIKASLELLSKANQN